MCLASIFGANMGDLFARNLGLGHVAGLPFLAAALAIVIVAERFDRIRHEVYYWIAIIIVRTAATNFADFAAGDLKLPSVWVMAGLTVLLVVALWLTWRFIWRRCQQDGRRASRRPRILDLHVHRRDIGNGRRRLLLA